MDQERWVDAGGMAYNLRYVKRFGIVKIRDTGGNLKLWMDGEPAAGRVIFVGSLSKIEWLYSNLVGWMNAGAEEQERVIYFIDDASAQYDASFKSAKGKRKAS